MEKVSDNNSLFLRREETKTFDTMSGTNNAGQDDSSIHKLNRSEFNPEN